MNVKELEKLVEALREEVQTLQTSMSVLRQAVDQLQTEAGQVEALKNRIIDLADAQEGMNDTLHRTFCAIEGMPSGVDEAEEDDEQRATRIGLSGRISQLEILVGSRNRSAPIKRNMTDADARRVLTGDAKDLAHKDAGAVVGITYAQVYSCRLEYTFKHVHKELREGGWKNPWVKK